MANTKEVILDGFSIDHVARVSVGTQRAAALAVRRVAEAVNVEKSARFNVESARREVEQFCGDGARLADTLEEGAAKLSDDAAKMAEARDAADAAALKLLGISPDFPDGKADCVKRYVSGEFELGEPIEYNSYGKKIFVPDVSAEIAKSFRRFAWTAPDTPPGDVAALPFMSALVKYEKARADLVAAENELGEAVRGAVAAVERLDAERMAERSSVAEALEMQRAKEASRKARAEILAARAEALRGA